MKYVAVEGVPEPVEPTTFRYAYKPITYVNAAGQVHVPKPPVPREWVHIDVSVTKINAWDSYQLRVPKEHLVGFTEDEIKQHVLDNIWDYYYDTVDSGDDGIERVDEFTFANLDELEGIIPTNTEE